VVLWIVWRRIELEEKRRGGAIDWLGTILITLALGATTFAFIEKVWPALIGGAIAFIAFLLVERRAANPIIPFSLFRSRSFTGANVLTLLLYAALVAATFLLPFNLIQVQGYTPAAAGAALLPFVATMSLMSRWTGALADRIGPRPLLIVGPLLAAAGLALLARPGIGGSYWTTFFPGVLVLGIGMAITVAPLTTTVMTSIDDERHAGAASGVNNAVARVAGLLAVAILGAAAVSVFSRDLDARLTRAQVPPPVRGAMAAKAEQLGDARAPKGSPHAKVIDQAVKESFVRAFRVDVLASAVLAALSAGGALLVTRRTSPK
jgi:MFS family permease